MMQISSTNYLPELGMEEPTYFHQFPMDSSYAEFQDLEFESFTASPDESYSSGNKRFNSESPDYSFAPARPTKQPKTETTWSAYGTDLIASKASSSSSSPKIISFEHSNVSSVTSSQPFHNMGAANVVKPKMESGFGENLDFAAVISQGAYDDKSFLYNENKLAATATIRNQVQARDHVLAERKRREKLSQRFIALSAVLPGLKKMDKATVLEDAISYLKQLKEQVKTLEEQVADKTVETAIFLKRSVVFGDDDGSFSDENSDQSLPEIEARVSGKDILIRIHCEKHHGKAVSAILVELEKHHLTVQSTSILPFGNNTLDITIITQMKKEYNLTTKELIKSLSQSLKQCA